MHLGNNIGAVGNLLKGLLELFAHDVHVCHLRLSEERKRGGEEEEGRRSGGGEGKRREERGEERRRERRRGVEGAPLRDVSTPVITSARVLSCLHVHHLRLSTP